MSEKGFTLVELVVALAISSIIFVALGTFLIFNLRSYNATTDIIDLQYEGQLAMNQLAALAKESKGIEFIVDQVGDDRIDEAGTIVPGSFDLAHYEYNDITGMDERTVYSISYEPGIGDMTGQITCRVTDPLGAVIEDYVMAKYVLDLTVTPESGQDFEMARSMTVTLVLENGEYDFDLQSEMKFRNKH